VAEAAGQGGGALPEGCVDVTIRAGLLGDAGWPENVRFVRGGLLRAENAVLVVWKGYRGYPDGTIPAFLEDTRTWVVVTALDPGTGAVLSHQLVDVFPPEVLTTESDVWSVALNPDGAFAVAGSWGSSQEVGPLELTLGRLGTEGVVQVDYCEDEECDATHVPTEVGWDGEAFAVHTHAADAGLEVARIAPDGTLLLPLTRYGAIGSAGYGIFGHRTLTNAESGNTIVFDADGSLRVSGHARDASSLPWVGEEGLIQVLPDLDSTNFPALGLEDGGGAWLVFSDMYGANLYSQAAYLAPDGNVAAPLRIDPPADDPGRGEAHAVVAHGADSALIYSRTGYRLYEYEITEGTLSEPRIVVSWSDEMLDLREMIAVEYGEERWLAFSQARELNVRVLKAVPGCVYPPP